MADAIATTRPLALGVVAVVMSGCPAIELPVDIAVLLPTDDSALSRTNNVSLTLEPLGVVETLPADGTDFALSLTLDPPSEPQRLSLFLAEDDQLLAWGTTPPVALRSDAGAVAVLVSAADALSRFGQPFDAPDPDALAAAVADIGLLVLAADGTAVFVDAFAWELRAAGALPSDAVPAPDDGILVPDVDGGVQRLAVAGGLSVQRYSPVDNAWVTRTVRQGDAAAPDDFAADRTDGIWVLAEAGTSAWLIGGGEHLDTLRIALSDDDAAPTRTVDLPPLDAPRPGATAFAAEDAPGTEEAILLFGSPQARPVVWSLPTGTALGPEGPWIGAACGTLPADGPTRDVLCVGGSRDGMPTGDGVLIRWPGAGASPTATELPDLLQGPMADPLVLSGSAAVYAQGDGRAVTIDTSLVSTVSASAPERGAGGSVARLPLGLSFVVGGTTVDGAPLRQWSTFIAAPAPAP